jgi:hypothetical protein
MDFQSDIETSAVEFCNDFPATPARNLSPVQDWPTVRDAFLADYKAHQALPDDASDKKLEASWRKVERTRAALFATPAPDLPAVFEKLEAAWLDDSPARLEDRETILREARQLRETAQAEDPTVVAFMRAFRADRASSGKDPRSRGISEADELFAYAAFDGMMERALIGLVRSEQQAALTLAIIYGELNLIHGDYYDALSPHLRDAVAKARDAVQNVWSFHAKHAEPQAEFSEFCGVSDRAIK